MQVIVEKMIDYLRATTDEVQKADVVKRLSELAERFAPDTQWFIDIMNQVHMPIHQGPKLLDSSTSRFRPCS